MVDNDVVKKIVLLRPRFQRLRILCIALLIAIQIPGLELISYANAQTSQNNKTVQIRKRAGSQNTRPVGFKDSANSKSNSLSPSLIDNSSTQTFTGDAADNLDYRVTRGCLRRSLNDDNLPGSIGIEDRTFSEFFRNQTRTFFEHMRGNCVPYAVALGKRNRFESLSIMNGPVQDNKTEIWTFTPSAVGGFLIQQDYLKDESKRFAEIQIPLRNVLYDPNKVSDKLPVELVWDLNALIKQIYPETNNTLENTNSVVRLIIDFGDRERWAQIWAVEIINPTNGEVYASAYWLERGDIPGGFFTANGEPLEHAFWTNPLSYRRISRGVGMVPAGRRKSTKPSAANTKAAVAAATNPQSQSGQNKQRYRAHMGIDYAAPIGTPVFSVATGKVIQLGFNGAFGNLIILEHPGNYRTYYAHLSSFNPELELGNEVRRGFEIGSVGMTGRSTGPHLHFELRKDGVYVDPYSAKTQLNLWLMRDTDSGQLTREILLLGSVLKN